MLTYTLALPTTQEITSCHQYCAKCVAAFTALAPPLTDDQPQAFCRWMHDGVQASRRRLALGHPGPCITLFAMLRGRNAGTPSCSSLGGHSYELIRTPGRALQRTNPDHGFIQQRSLRRCLHGRPWIFVTAPIRPVPACIRGGARWHAPSSAEEGRQLRSSERPALFFWLVE